MPMNMVETATKTEDDFSEKLQALVIEAGHSGTARPSASETATKPAEDSFNLENVLRILETVMHLQLEHSHTIQRVEKNLLCLDTLAQSVGETRSALDQRGGVSRAMFEALHSELKSYKDSFIVDVVLRPVIRDLITLYDDLAAVQRQLDASLHQHSSSDVPAGKWLMFLENTQLTASNLAHNLHFILEVLERLGVTMVDAGTGRLDKLRQKAVSVERAESAEQDQMIVRSLKPGFQWRDRIIRPEEVVVYKWNNGVAPSGVSTVSSSDHA